MNFTDYTCLICAKRFKKDDEVVVCPDCGTPYHKECYLETGKCVNTPLHESGKSFRETRPTTEPPIAEEMPENEEVVCAKCKAHNSKYSTHCQNCGERIKPAQQVITEILELIDSTKAEEEKSKTNPNYQSASAGKITNDFVGYTAEQSIGFVKSNTMRYFPLFVSLSRNEQHGYEKCLSFNLFAGILPPFYYAFRKMPGWSFLYIILWSICMIPAMLTYYVTQFGDVGGAINLESAVFLQFSEACKWGFILVNFMSFFFADWVYFKHMSRKLRRINFRFGKNAAQSNFLIAKQGGTNIFGVLIAFFVLNFVSAFASYVFCYSFYGFFPTFPQTA